MNRRLHLTRTPVSIHLLLITFLCSLVTVSLNSQTPPANNSFYYTGTIFPTPQKADYGKDFIALRLNQREKVAIIIPKNASSYEVHQAESLKTDLENSYPLLSGNISIYGHSHRLPADTKMVVKMALSENIFFSKELSGYHLRPEDHPEGYFLVTKDVKNSTVLLAGNDKRGLYYGLQSLRQLIHLSPTRNGDNLLVREAVISDYPYYSLRISGNDEDIPTGDIPLQAVEWLSFVKMNGWAVGQSYWLPPNWRHTPQEQLNSLKTASRKAQIIGFDLVFQVHPFGRANDPHNSKTITISDPEERSKLLNICLDMLKSGASTILLRADDFSDLVETDVSIYQDKATAHSSLANELLTMMKRDFPSVKLIFCPPYYWSNSFRSDDGYTYITTLAQRLDKSIPIMWTGPEVVSHSISEQDLRRFVTLTGRNPLLWDNTALPSVNRFGYPYTYAFYLFHPFTTEYPQNHYQLSQGIRFNFGYNGSEVFKVGNAVLADYMWNPRSFDTAASLKAALALIVGSAAVDTALELTAKLQLTFDLRHSPAVAWTLADVPTTTGIQQLLDKLAAETENNAFCREMDTIRWTMYQNLTSLDKLLEDTRKIRTNSLTATNINDFNITTAGNWKVVRTINEVHNSDRQLFRLSFPYNTPGSAGAKAEASVRIPVPFSSTGKYYLHFLADNDYYADGEPPSAWPGYFFMQIDIDGNTVWEKDVVGMEEIQVKEVDITANVSGKKDFALTLRGIDKQGVYNLGVNMTFSRIYLSPQPVNQ